MKIKLSVIILALAGTTINLFAAPPPLPAPLPEFMNQQQLDQWTAKEASKKQDSASAQEAPTQFYTGKPYVPDAGGYVYNCRTYNPEMSRWTSADPSGYPNGSNNQTLAYAPINGFDSNGLTWTFTTGNNTQSTTPVNYSSPVGFVTLTTNQSYSITGYGTTQLTIEVTAQTTFSDPYQSSQTADASGTFQLNINPVTGYVTVSGQYQNTAVDTGFTLGTEGAPYNAGIANNQSGSTNTIQGKIAFGADYDSGGGTAQIGYSGQGVSVGLTFPPVTATWPTGLAFTIYSSE